MFLLTILYIDYSLQSIAMVCISCFFVPFLMLVVAYLADILSFTSTLPVIGTPSQILLNTLNLQNTRKVSSNNNNQQQQLQANSNTNQQ